MFYVLLASTLCAAAPNFNTPSFNTPRFDVLETDMASVLASVLAVLVVTLASTWASTWALTLIVSDGLHRTVRKTFRALALPTRLHC